MAGQQEAKSVNDGIANSQDNVQVLKGIQPKHQIAYKFFKMCRFLAIFGFVLAALAIAAAILAPKTQNEFIMSIMYTKAYRLYFCIGLAGLSAFILFLGIVTKLLFLRKAPFDDWVYEIAEKTLGTSIIFYDSRYIYINYNRHGKEVEKKDFVMEMSDKSVNYSYFFVKTDIDTGYIVVECKRRQPIPKKATFESSNDVHWNIILLGDTIHPVRQTIAPIGWYLNNNEEDEKLLKTIPSPSILIAGGTGCFDKDTPIPMSDTLVR